MKLNFSVIIHHQHKFLVDEHYGVHILKTSFAANVGVQLELWSDCCPVSTFNKSFLCAIDNTRISLSIQIKEEASNFVNYKSKFENRILNFV